jgi:hypothetical protein
MKKSAKDVCINDNFHLQDMHALCSHAAGTCTDTTQGSNRQQKGSG